MFERLEGLIHGSLRIETVQMVNIDVVRLQARRLASQAWIR